MTNIPFSPYDFRYWISVNDPVDSEKLQNSLLREHWSALLSSWTYLGKPKKYLQLFQQVVQQGIGSQRYSISLVQNSVFDYPEFWVPALNGCIQVWIHLPLNVKNAVLNIGKTPASITLDPEDQILLIDLLYIGKPFTLHVNGKDYTICPWMSYSARQLWFLINQLGCAIKNRN